MRSAKYVFKGTEGFERFCSATLEVIHGVPWYFTGEEAVNGIPPAPPAGHDGSSIAMNAKTGNWVETEHFGHLQHENVVPTKLSKWFFLTTDDDFRPGQDFVPLRVHREELQGRDQRQPREGQPVRLEGRQRASTRPDIEKGETLTGSFVPITPGRERELA